jgi:hypothetical protein
MATIPNLSFLGMTYAELGNSKKIGENVQKLQLSLNLNKICNVSQIKPNQSLKSHSSVAKSIKPDSGDLPFQTKETAEKSKTQQAQTSSVILHTPELESKPKFESVKQLITKYNKIAAENNDNIVHGNAPGAQHRADLGKNAGKSNAPTPAPSVAEGKTGIEAPKVTEPSLQRSTRAKTAASKETPILFSIMPWTSRYPANSPIKIEKGIVQKNRAIFNDLPIEFFRQRSDENTGNVRITGRNV